MENKEILTLQFGHYSNFIGTHWWNIQEQGFEYDPTKPNEINHDCLYREGLTSNRQVTFTPRLLLVDLKESLKTLPEQGDLYEPVLDASKTEIEWSSDKLNIQKTQNIPRNQFLNDLASSIDSSNIFNNTYNLEKDVEVWTDFLYSRFHPRTVNIIKEYQHCNIHTPFDIFPLGTELWKKPQFEEDFSDKIRNYIEECNSFQGFHIVLDTYNAFAGLSSACMEHLRDEYATKSVLAFPVIPSYYSDYEFQTDEEKLQSTMNDSIRVLNLCLGFNQYFEHSNLFVPLCTSDKGWRQPGNARIFPHLNYESKLPYHTSAILAVTLETLTMKHRLKSNNFSLIDLCTDLNQYGRKTAAASTSLPFPIHSNCDLLDHLDKWEGPLMQSITPNCTIGDNGILQYITLRGISENRLKKPIEKSGKQRELPAYRCSTISEMLQMYLTYSTDTVSNVTVVHKPVNVKNPFPRFFDKSVSETGTIYDIPKSSSTDVGSVPVLAGFHTGAEVGEMLETLHTQANRIKIRKLHQFTENGLNKDDFEECLNNLFTFRENYENNYLI